MSCLLRLSTVWCSYELGLQHIERLDIADLANVMWNVEYSTGDQQLLLRYPPLRVSGNIEGLATGVVAYVSPKGKVRVFVNGIDDPVMLEAVCTFTFRHIREHLLAQQPHLTVCFQKFRVVSWKGHGTLVIVSNAKRSKRTREDTSTTSSLLTLEAVKLAALAVSKGSCDISYARSAGNVVTIQSRNDHRDHPPSGAAAASDDDHDEAGGEFGNLWIHLELSLKTRKVVVKHAMSAEAANAFVSALAVKLGENCPT